MQAAILAACLELGSTISSAKHKAELHQNAICWQFVDPLNPTATVMSANECPMTFWYHIFMLLLFLCIENPELG